MSEKTGLLLLLLRVKDGAAVYLDLVQNALFLLENAEAPNALPLAEQEDESHNCMKHGEPCLALGYGECARCPLSATGGHLCGFWASKDFARVLDMRTEADATFGDLGALRAALADSVEPTGGM